MEIITKVYYKAINGSVFESQEECKKYEDTLKEEIYKEVKHKKNIEMMREYCESEYQDDEDIDVYHIEERFFNILATRYEELYNEDTNSHVSKVKTELMDKAFNEYKDEVEKYLVTICPAVY